MADPALEGWKPRTLPGFFDLVGPLWTRKEGDSWAYGIAGGGQAHQSRRNRARRNAGHAARPRTERHRLGSQRPQTVHHRRARRPFPCAGAAGPVRRRPRPHRSPSFFAGFHARQSDRGWRRNRHRLRNSENQVDGSNTSATNARSSGDRYAVRRRIGARRPQWTYRR